MFKSAQPVNSWQTGSAVSFAGMFEDTSVFDLADGRGGGHGGHVQQRNSFQRLRR